MLENNPIPLSEMRGTITEVKKNLNLHYKKLAFIAREQDFNDLIMLRGELKDAILESTKLFEQWIEREMPPMK